jgi:hypothetical protein
LTNTSVSSFSRDDDDSRPSTVSPADGKADGQLWQHLQHDIVADRVLLEGASETPTKLLELAQNQVHVVRRS